MTHNKTNEHLFWDKLRQRKKSGLGTYNLSKCQFDVLLNCKTSSTSLEILVFINDWFVVSQKANYFQFIL